MSTIIDVDPEVFDAASKIFGQDMASGVETAWSKLTSALSPTAGMAGSDQAGTGWAAQYDPAAQGAVGVIQDLSNACTQIAALLEQTGFNHGMAESSSDPTRSVPTPADKTSYVVTGGSGLVCVPGHDVPLAAGGSSSPPTGWGIVEAAVGYVWPNGDSGKLRTAANAWTTAASSLQAVSYYVPEAMEAVSAQQSPEVDDAVTVCNSMSTHLTDTASGCTSLASACTQLANHIDTAHTAIENEITSFLEWSAGIEVVGGLVSIFTAGIAEAPTQGVEAGRIAATAARIAEIIRTLIAAADTITTAVAGIIDRIAVVASRLRVILGAKLSEVVANLAERLPSLGKDGGDVALGKLSAWDKGWSERGFDIEKQLGGDLPASFPTIDKIPGGVATSIKSVDLSAPTYQNAAKLSSRLKSYVDKVSKFDGATWGGREIDEDDITGRALQVAIQPGVASPAQTAVLNEMATYARSKGVNLIISEVP